MNSRKALISFEFSKIEPFGNLLAKNYTKQFAYGNFCK